MESEIVSRYDNLHGDEDEQYYISESHENWEYELADQENDRLWLLERDHEDN